MGWYIAVLKKYAVFNGRARRKEYWYFILCNFLLSFAIGFVDTLTGNFNSETGMGLFSMSTKPIAKLNKKLHKMKYQYSFRRARPLKTAYFFKTAIYQPI
jgi:hypothetical protein